MKRIHLSVNSFIYSYFYRKYLGSNIFNKRAVANNVVFEFSMLRQAETRSTFIVKILFIVGLESVNNGYITKLDDANES